MSNEVNTHRVRFVGSFAWVKSPAIKKIVTALGADNIRFVGGAVRDSLLKKKAREIDLATLLSPQIVLELLTASGIRTVPTGIAHGTVTAVFKEQSFEITTLRHDIKTFGRHAEVAFHSSWKADAARRDFTMNALFLSLDGIIHDYFGGITDLRRGKIRFIGDPKTRISEDALRILRFFRFHAWYGRGALDRIGYAACEANLALLDILSAERIRDEIFKLLGSPNPIPVVIAMGRIGIFHQLLAVKDIDFGSLRTLVRVETSIGETDHLRRLAALFPLEAHQLSSLGGRLKLSNRDLARLINMKEGRLTPPLSKNEVRKAIYFIGSIALKDQLILKARPTEVGLLRQTLKTLNSVKLPSFPVSGEDLKMRGLIPGPKMGETLDYLEKKWVSSDFSLTKRELLSMLS